MAQQIYVKKVIHEKYGELYQFLKLDTESGIEEVLHPFESGLFSQLKEEAPEMFHIQSKRGADATGYFKGDKFIVIEGSKFALSTSPKCPKQYIKLREGLVLAKLLVPLHTQLLVMEDITFDSPVAAMGAAIGGWVKGPHGWKEVKNI